MGEGLREECGVFGVVGDADAAKLVCLGLHALQHRGQEGCGIVSWSPDDTAHFHVHKSFKLVSDAFPADILSKLVGNSAVGHVRYSTQGGRKIQNIQPFQFRTAIGEFAIAHNGNLTNAKELRAELEGSGSIFHSTSDSEVFIHLLARSEGKSIVERIAKVMKAVNGAYSVVILAQDRLFAVRDPYGFRPLVFGKRGSSYIVASETCALDLIDAEFIREVAPGEVVELVPGSEPKTCFPVESTTRAFCSFEAIYFGRPDSQVFGEVIYNMRKRMGAVLAKESPAPNADMVIAIPDSGVPMAMGFAEAAKLPYEIGLVRNHYIGRTFIEPTQEIREFGVRLKLNPVLNLLRDKRVVVVDDSIVRGTTSAKIVRLLRRAGAKEIHFRIGSPPITHSCYYGVDTPERSQLLAAQFDVEKIRDFIGSDSLGYLSRDGLKAALGSTNGAQYCYACFNGQYPESVHDKILPQPTDKSGPGLRAGLAKN
jgi:amidophosphoribosyltransferase